MNFGELCAQVAQLKKDGVAPDSPVIAAPIVPGQRAKSIASVSFAADDVEIVKFRKVLRGNVYVEVK